jgi:type II secretion system protein N
MNNEIEADDVGASSSLGRRLLIIMAVLLLLLVVAYFVVTSSGFFKGFILPRVGKAMNAEITVADASISPFSQVVLDKLKVQTTGTEPLLTADQVRVRYSLFSIMGGNYVVNELTVAKPNIALVTDANGASNLDPITQGSGKSSAKSDEPLRLALRNVAIKDGTVRMVQKAKDGSTQSTEIGQLNLSADRIENGQAGKATVAALVTLDNRPPAGLAGTNDLLEGKINGDFAFKLDQKLLPQELTGNAGLAFAKGQGAYAELSGLGSSLQVEMTPSEVRQMLVAFQKNGQGLGRIRASGPLDLAKYEGRVKLEVQSIDRQVLNLFGATRGWDFADSTLNATNYVDVAHQGDVLGAKGTMMARQFGIRAEGQSTPPLDVDVEYEVTVKRNDQTATLHKLSIVGRQQERELLRSILRSPMNLTWAANAKSIVNSTNDLTLSGFELAQWQLLLGTNMPSGRLDLQTTVESKQDGKELTTKANARLQGFSTMVGSNRLENADISAYLEGKLENFRTLDVTQYRAEVQQSGTTLAKASGSAHYDLSKPDLAVQASAELAVNEIARRFPQPDLAASKGIARLSTAVTQKNQRYSATGNVSLTDFTGRYGEYAFQDFQTALDYDVTFEEPTVQIRSASVTFRKGYNSAGNITVTGEYKRDTEVAQATFKLVDLNEHALGAFLAPSLGDKKLVSISMNGTGSATYDPRGDSAVKADLGLSKWVVSAPEQNFVSPTLQADVKLDGAMRQEVIDLRQFLVKLSPTGGAKNELLMKGRLDMGKTNATPSQLSIQADSLDVTPYYNMFAGGAVATNAAPAAAPSSSPAPIAASPASMAEPAPMTLPFQQLTADLKVGSLLLRGLAFSNLQTAVRIKGTECAVQPVAFQLNGAPVNASALLNLGVPGYRYDLSLKADGIPIEALSTNLTTNAPGLYSGNLYVQTQLKGAGVTGRSLQKNLGGNLSLNLTNMTYEVVGPKAKRLLEPIALVLRVPELTQTPINWISSYLTIGNGQADVQQFIVQSQAFHAESQGAIPMAEILTNSPLNLPVKLSLRRTLAEKANLVAANAPTNNVYAELPTFVTLTGTVGEPKTEINKLVIAGLLAKSIGGIAPIGDNAGALLQNLGGALSGQPTAVRTNALSSTNAAANLIQGIGGLLGAKPASSTNAPAAANTNSGAGALMQGLGGLLGTRQPQPTNAPPSGTSGLRIPAPQTSGARTNPAPAGTNAPARSPLGSLLQLIPEKK